MQRRILIVDDHDDLKSALSDVFGKLGFLVQATESREEALKIDRKNEFDLVITDLDGDKAFSENNSDNAFPCLPKIETDELDRSIVKAFKICAINFRRDEFHEDELKNFFETILNFKSQFIDKTESVKNIREKIEFEFPSAISLMNSILSYLIKRVEKMGIVDIEKSNLFVALDEAFVNAIKHGNKYDKDKIVRISAEISPKEARFMIEDEGEGFDVSDIPDPTKPENLFKASGRGVLFIHNIMDEVEYNDRGNRLTMIKRKDLEV